MRWGLGLSSPRAEGRRRNPLASTRCQALNGQPKHCALTCQSSQPSGMSAPWLESVASKDVLQAALPPQVGSPFAPHLPKLPKSILSAIFGCATAAVAVLSCVRAAMDCFCAAASRRAVSILERVAGEKAATAARNASGARPARAVRAAWQMGESSRSEDGASACVLMPWTRMGSTRE